MFIQSNSVAIGNASNNIDDVYINLGAIILYANVFGLSRNRVIGFYFGVDRAQQHLMLAITYLGFHCESFHQNLHQGPYMYHNPPYH